MRLARSTVMKLVMILTSLVWALPLAACHDRTNDSMAPAQTSAEPRPVGIDDATAVRNTGAVPPLAASTGTPNVGPPTGDMDGDPDRRARSSHAPDGGAELGARSSSANTSKATR